MDNPFKCYVKKKSFQDGFKHICKLSKIIQGAKNFTVYLLKSILNYSIKLNYLSYYIICLYTNFIYNLWNKINKLILA